MLYEDFEKDIQAKVRGTYFRDRAMQKEDLAQEIRVAVWSAESQFDPARGASPRTYANRVMQNKKADILRKDMRHPFMGRLPEEEDWLEGYE